MIVLAPDEEMAPDKVVKQLQTLARQALVDAQRRSLSFWTRIRKKCKEIYSSRCVVCACFRFVRALLARFVEAWRASVRRQGASCMGHRTCFLIVMIVDEHA